MRSLQLALILVASFPLAALGQAGGYSAGPGQQPSHYRPSALADGGTPPETGASTENEPEFTTQVVSYRSSPAFTQDREFTTTRLWVLDPGKFTVEQWWNGAFGSRRATPSAYPGDQFFQTEFEMGLARHLQMDIYANYEFDQDETGTYKVATGGHTGVAVELRVALGSYWGQYWGNPTLYFELTSQYYNSPRGEFRLLLGGSVFTPKLLGALNLAFERNLFRDSQSGIDYEVKADYGLNYELVPGILRAGVEGVLGFDGHGTLGDQGQSLLHPVVSAGPSILLTEPHKRVKLLGALLHGFAAWDQPWLPTVIVSTSF